MLRSKKKAGEEIPKPCGSSKSSQFGEYCSLICTMLKMDQKD